MPYILRILIDLTWVVWIPGHVNKAFRGYVNTDSRGMWDAKIGDPEIAIHVSGIVFWKNLIQA